MDYAFEVLVTYSIVGLLVVGFIDLCEKVFPEIGDKLCELLYGEDWDK